MSIKENFGRLSERTHWKLERKEPAPLHRTDLRAMTYKEQNQVIDWYANNHSLEDLRQKQENLDLRIKRVHRSGEATEGAIGLGNLQIRRALLDAAIQKVQFGEGWTVPEWALPKAALDEVDLEYHRADPLTPDEQKSAWETYGMKQTPGFAPPSWALPKKQLDEKVVYVLKNHNGRVLAKHTDPKKLAAEMLKYERQTGNETRIEVLQGVNEARQTKAQSVAAKRSFIKRAYAKQGTYSVPGIDPDEYPPIRGMEGPFRMGKAHGKMHGRVLYYDPREGKYYDRKTDMYVDM